MVPNIKATNNINGFSIIELMMVVAMLAVLATASVPYYRSYIIRAEVTRSLTLLNGLNKYAKQLNDDGLLQLPLEYAGTTFATSGTEVAYDYPPAKRAVIYTAGFFPEIATDEWMVCLYLDNLSGISDYVAPTTTSNGSYSRVCNLISYSNGFYASYCGVWDTGANIDVPIKYLPEGCNCQDIRNRAC